MRWQWVNYLKLYIIFCALVGFLNPGILKASEVVNISATVLSAPSSGGGGGGGGGGLFAPTKITFSGRAYPLSKVTILRDGVLVITTISGPDARFSVSLDGLNPGNYNFSIYGEDSAQRKSSAFSFPLYITQGATTTVSGIFIAPTIGVDKLEVKQGDNINIFGVSAPSSSITISVHSQVEHFVETRTDSNGVYLYTFDTSPLEIGKHETKSKVKIAETASEFGKAILFNVGNKNIIKEDEQICGSRGDLSQDCKVNIVDFSVLAYWYKRLNVPIAIDLNGDKKITLIDFSIMAYYWTG